MGQNPSRQNSRYVVSFNSCHKNLTVYVYDKQYAKLPGLLVFFCLWIALIRFQLALVSVNLAVSLPWNVSGEPQ